MTASITLNELIKDALVILKTTTTFIFQKQTQSGGS